MDTSQNTRDRRRTDRKDAMLAQDQYKMRRRRSTISKSNSVERGEKSPSSDSVVSSPVLNATIDEDSDDSAFEMRRKKKLPKTPKTPMDYIRNREELIESEITLPGLWNDEDVSNTDVHGSGRDSTSTNVRRSVKSPKSPNSLRSRKKVKVKDT